MKVSVKLQDHHKSHDQNHHPPPLLLRAKIPITIFNLPFLSHFSTTTTHPSDLSLSLSTNLPSGPSLKLSYASSSSAAGAEASAAPLPQLGSFSLRKSTFSHAGSGGSSERTDGLAGCDSNSFGFVPLESPASVKDLSVERNDKDSIFKGIQLAARTEMLVGKRVALNFRWFTKFSDDQMPVLRINKIGIQRVDDVLKDDEESKKKSEAKAGELEMLKGMCFWMKRELDVLTRVNREMKCELEEMRVGHLARNGGGDIREGVAKRTMPSVRSPSGGFEQWRSKRNGGGQENGNVNWEKEEKKNSSLAIDVENELQRAIKAAGAAP
ncbi:UNVERIFIED_CONTAM: hypothetical protein Sradi_1868900 [Sesamum radiatum]|uniref:Uncharacterized protein n=1 Tax=Sesamum radiatum TaxID=300843 RepID=A0AAW2TWD6_SESRA